LSPSPSASASASAGSLTTQLTHSLSTVVERRTEKDPDDAKTPEKI